MTADVNAAAAACPMPREGSKPKTQKAAAGGCPVDHESSKAEMTGCPVDHKSSKPPSPSTEGCPVQHEDGKQDSGFSAQMMRAANNAAGWNVSAGSSGFNPRLSKARAVSSIPKSDFTPAHQTGTEENWEYPSEDMYFKAMKRKGWAPNAQQMKTIVAIHNTVNEQSWQEVLKWESFHPGQEPPKLKRFMGKPTEYSPKAKIMNALGWSVLPFDRHDWIVERDDGKEVRYVIDFYSGQPEPGRPLSVYLDVRPALDSVEGAVDRLRWQFHEKIMPLLPFQGAIFGGSKPSSARPDNAAPGAEAQSVGNSKVTPKTN